MGSLCAKTVLATASGPLIFFPVSQSLMCSAMVECIRSSIPRISLFDNSVPGSVVVDLAVLPRYPSQLVAVWFTSPAVNHAAEERIVCPTPARPLLMSAFVSAPPHSLRCTSLVGGRGYTGGSGSPGGSYPPPPSASPSQPQGPPYAPQPYRHPYQPGHHIRYASPQEATFPLTPSPLDGWKKVSQVWGKCETQTVGNRVGGCNIPSKGHKLVLSHTSGMGSGVFGLTIRVSIDGGLFASLENPSFPSHRTHALVFRSESQCDLIGTT
ncbi:hypothetical protein AAG570_008529 [Ranatra chinensis]|uniref:Uncharacterized protein n=1 Tax=Ranatra chinensis TaxID=642074 RepID=A0ABD0YR85_9HEMI